MARVRRSWWIGLLILSLAAGPSSLVQVLGWTSMLATRLPTQGLQAGWNSTFSGRAPCSMCMVADSLRRSEGALPSDDGRYQWRSSSKKPDHAPPAPGILMEPVAMAVALQEWPLSTKGTPGEHPTPEPPPPREI